MLYIAPDVFVAPVRDKIVVLNLAHDKYTALSAGLSALLSEIVGTPFSLPASGGRAITLKDSTPAKILVAQGILTQTPPLSTARSAWAIVTPPATTRWPSARWENENQSRRGIGPFLATMKALCEVSIALRFKPFKEIINQIEKEPVRRFSAGPAKSEQDTLDDFFASRPWYPVKPICRLDAPALCLHLRRNGHPASLVFGVTLEKFSAHCWVQCGARVMREPHETVAGYSPILVV